MTAGGCRAALVDSDLYARARSLDDAFPGCACEAWSLCEAGGEPVQANELVARILTSPDSYDESAETIVTQKLSALYSLGLSVVRQGASDAEITGTAEQLVAGGAEERRLMGAIVVSAADLRAYSDPSRWFGVYATDDQGKSHHVDVFGTTPDGGNSKIERIKRQRRYTLADDLGQKIIFANDCDTLIQKLRAAGI